MGKQILALKKGKTKEEKSEKLKEKPEKFRKDKKEKDDIFAFSSAKHAKFWKKMKQKKDHSKIDSTSVGSFTDLTEKIKPEKQVTPKGFERKRLTVKEDAFTRFKKFAPPEFKARFTQLQGNRIPKIYYCQRLDFLENLMSDFGQPESKKGRLTGRESQVALEIFTHLVSILLMNKEVYKGVSELFSFTESTQREVHHSLFSLCWYQTDENDDTVDDMDATAKKGNINFHTKRLLIWCLASLLQIPNEKVFEIVKKALDKKMSHERIMISYLNYHHEKNIKESKFYSGATFTSDEIHRCWVEDQTRNKENVYKIVNPKNADEKPPFPILCDHIEVNTIYSLLIWCCLSMYVARDDSTAAGNQEPLDQIPESVSEMDMNNLDSPNNTTTGSTVGAKKRSDFVNRRLTSGFASLAHQLATWHSITSSRVILMTLTSTLHMFQKYNDESNIKNVRNESPESFILRNYEDIQKERLTKNEYKLNFLPDEKPECESHLEIEHSEWNDFSIGTILDCLMYTASLSTKGQMLFNDKEMESLIASVETVCKIKTIQDDTVGIVRVVLQNSNNHLNILGIPLQRLQVELISCLLSSWATLQELTLTSWVDNAMVFDKWEPDYECKGATSSAINVYEICDSLNFIFRDFLLLETEENGITLLSKMVVQILSKVLITYLNALTRLCFDLDVTLRVDGAQVDTKNIFSPLTKRSTAESFPMIHKSVSNQSTTSNSDKEDTPRKLRPNQISCMSNLFSSIENIGDMSNVKYLSDPEIQRMNNSAHIRPIRKVSTEIQYKVGLITNNIFFIEEYVADILFFRFKGPAKKVCNTILQRFLTVEIPNARRNSWILLGFPTPDRRAIDEMLREIILKNEKSQIPELIELLTELIHEMIDTLYENPLIGLATFYLECLCDRLCFMFMQNVLTEKQLPAFSHLRKVIHDYFVHLRVPEETVKTALRAVGSIAFDPSQPMIDLDSLDYDEDSKSTDFVVIKAKTFLGLDV